MVNHSAYTFITNATKLQLYERAGDRTEFSRIGVLLYYGPASLLKAYPCIQINYQVHSLYTSTRAP